MNYRADFVAGANERSLDAATVASVRAVTRALWLLVGLMAAFAIVCLRVLEMRVDFTSNPVLLAIAAAYAGLTLYYVTMRNEPRLGGALLTAGQLFIILFVGLLLTYAAMAVALPYRDAELYAADRWLGFDRAAYLALVDAHPWLGTTLNVAYLSIMPQMALVPFLLLLAGQTSRLQRFTLAFGLALVATAFVSAFIPAQDAFIYVDLARRGVASLPPRFYTQIPTLDALPANMPYSVRLDNLEGLVTFPSFHTASAIMFTWALRRVRYVGWIAAAVNVLMILSTPYSGAHDLVDVLAGAVVAVAAIGASIRVAARLQRRECRLLALTY